VLTCGPTGLRIDGIRMTRTSPVGIAGGLSSMRVAVAVGGRDCWVEGRC
jgi:hypothetical protein